MKSLPKPLRIFPKKIEAACYNRARLAQLRTKSALRVSLQKHRGLEVILNADNWLCVDSFAEDQPVLAWCDFEVHARSDLHRPIATKLWLFHSCSGLIMGSALDDLHQTLNEMEICQSEVTGL
ncbi:hypothetical protein SAMN05216302_102743 [Nitrosomonas aestuarii]|uniref:Uncharacterized protein n=1 Tax=Nitrosomonas aestuarii TaxID=52441 RepID=A0A1I4EG71_9PROT|nr:hypothetical protein [Nitrosomonas aestuarii]SFL03597.1 hypothetical protein SAMN05216302_102743 [Nitrosomonas aestuarii]